MINLSKRNFNLVEEMDNPSCDLELLENTYSQFSKINALLSGWRKIYLKYLKPILLQNPNATLLDIGFGGGDIVIHLNKLAKRDNLNLNITAIETDSRSIEYIKKLPLEKTHGINFRLASLEEITHENLTFDIVISNHVLHHLSDDYLHSFLSLSKDISTQLVLHNDLERNGLAFNLFKLSGIFFKHSFIKNDGLTSIQRSLTKPELENLCGLKWQVNKLFHFRLIAFSKK